MAKREYLEIENAQLKWPNFSGRPTDFKPQGGVRSVNVVLEDDEMTQKLIDDGWNVKIKAPREEGDEPLKYLEVFIRFDNFPPKVYMVSSRNKVELDEDTIGDLDNYEIESADLIINPYNWEANGKTGIKAYLKTGYFNIVEDRFAAKYDKPAEIEIPFD